MKPIRADKPIFPDPEPGWYNLDGSTYHQGPGLSKSMMGPLAQSPAHLEAYLATPRTETAAMTFGDAFHARVLEPSRFVTEFAFMPALLDGRSKEGKAWKAENAGKKILKGEDQQTLEKMRAAVMAHPFARVLVEGQQRAAVEVSGYFREPVTGILGKIRPDIVSTILDMTLVDLKTCRDASAAGFQKDAYNLGYPRQGAWYLYGASQIEGAEVRHFAFIAIEKEPPYAVNVWRAGADFLQVGQIEVIKLARIYADCQAKGEWTLTEPGYSPEIRDLDLPGWVKRRSEASVIWEGGGGPF